MRTCSVGQHSLLITVLSNVPNSHLESTTEPAARARFSSARAGVEMVAAVAGVKEVKATGRLFSSSKPGDMALTRGCFSSR